MKMKISYNPNQDEDAIQRPVPDFPLDLGVYRRVSKFPCPSSFHPITTKII